jgi:Subtilase family
VKSKRKDSNKINYKKLISLPLIYGLLFYGLVTVLTHFNIVNGQGKLTNSTDVGLPLLREGSLDLGKTGLEMHYSFVLAKSNQTVPFKGLGQAGATPAGQPIVDQVIITSDNINGSAEVLKENQLGVYSLSTKDNTTGVKIPSSITKPSTSSLGRNESSQTTLGDLDRIVNPDKFATTESLIGSKNLNESKPVLNATGTEICQPFLHNKSITHCELDTAGSTASINSASYNLDRIGAYSGPSVKPFWTKSLDLSNAPTVIYFMDSGVNPHIDLNVIGNITFMQDLVDPINNVVVNNSADRDNHGTHVAGIAAAKDNSIGTIGVAPGAKIFSLKVLDKDSFIRGGKQTFKNALDYIINHAIQDKIKLVNLSITLGKNDKDLEKLVKKAVDKGVTFIAAAGNARPEEGGVPKDVTNSWPGSDPNVIVVGSMADSDGRCGGKGSDIKVFSNEGHDYTSYIDKDDVFSTFSNYGPKVDLVAPGENINSTDSDGKGYHLDSGTSMAAPHVTGAAALFLAAHADASPAQVKSALQNASSSLVNCDAEGHGPFIGNDPSNSHHPVLYTKTLLPPS